MSKRILNNDDTKLCAERFEEIIEEHISPDELFHVLDSAMCDYADLIMKGGDPASEDQVKNIYWLKCMRDIFIQNDNN